MPAGYSGWPWGTTRHRRSETAMPNLASQMRTAFASMAWNTGSSSPGELLMTFKHLGGRGLLLERLGEVAGALAQLVEQPGILDGDDGLLGEIGHQLDLLVGERPDLLAVDRDRSDELTLLDHRHRNMRSRAGKLGRRGLDPFCCLVEGMDDLFRPDEAIEGLFRAPAHRGYAAEENRPMPAAHSGWPRGTTRHCGSETGCRTWPRRCGSRSPVWPGTPAPAPPASC